jgi:myosin heavy subunit
LLVKGPTSIFKILEDECKKKLQSGKLEAFETSMKVLQLLPLSERRFLQQVHAIHKRNKTTAFVIDHTHEARNIFGVYHYAGRVDYLAKAFVEKNVDKVTDRILRYVAVCDRHLLL